MEPEEPVSTAVTTPTLRRMSAVMAGWERQMCTKQGQRNTTEAGVEDQQAWHRVARWDWAVVRRASATPALTVTPRLRTRTLPIAAPLVVAATPALLLRVEAVEELLAGVR